jgi:hypothetical protein
MGSSWNKKIVSKHEPDDPQNEIFFLESPKFWSTFLLELYHSLLHQS